MVEKTELMKQFEDENPEKHAIWAGKITNQFKKWEKSRMDSETPTVKDKIENEVVLFLALSKIKDPTYNKIMEFCSSFNMKSNEIIEILLKKIREGDIAYNLPVNSILREIYLDLLNLRNLKIPYTIRVNEALEIFNHLNFHKPLDILEFFRGIKKEFPNFISISSSKLNQPEDLITFKRLFPNIINFKLGNRWAI
jgi:hypothetical protein